MRELNIGSCQFTKILVRDKPSHGGACHEYYISRPGVPQNTNIGEFGHIYFQKGPIEEFGINGCQHEDLLNIVIDRLESFQHGPFACLENGLAITKIQEAIHWMNHRTNERVKRGVEGTSEK